MRVGQPRVQRWHGQFYEEGQGEAEQQPHLRDRRQVAALQDERIEADGTSCRTEIEYRGQQTEAGNGVEYQELDGRGFALAMAPERDEQETRHEHAFPKKGEHQQVERQKDAVGGRYGPAQRGMEQAGPLVHLPRDDHRYGAEHQRHGEQQRGQAVERENDVDAEARCPCNPILSDPSSWIAA